MDLRPLSVDRPVVRRFVEDLWLPYHRDLEATVESHALVDGVADALGEETDFWLSWFDDPDRHGWVAVDDPADERGGGAGAPLVDPGIEFVGFVTTEREAAPPVFERPDRLVVGDLYVREDHRGTGLARELIERAARRARESGCPELALDVDADNDRALAFYGKLGFEPHRHRLLVDVDGL